MSDNTFNVPSSAAVSSDVTSDTSFDASNDTSDSSFDSDASEATPSEQQQVQKYKLKANGAEREYTLEELQKFASMGISSQEKWQEASTLRKQNEAFLKQLKSDPLAILQNPNLGLDVQEIAMKILMNDIEEKSLSPEQKKQRDMEKELEGYRSKTREETERLEQEKQAKADQEWATNTKTQVQSGLKSSGLPYTQFTWNSTLQYMSAAMDAGYEDVTPDQVMHLVKRDYQEAMQSMYSLPVEELLQQIGDENIAKIQQAVIQKAKGNGYQPPRKEESTSLKPGGKMSYEDFIKEQKEKLKRGEI